MSFIRAGLKIRNCHSMFKWVVVCDAEYDAILFSVCTYYVCLHVVCDSAVEEFVLYNVRMCGLGGMKGMFVYVVVCVLVVGVGDLSRGSTSVWVYVCSKYINN